MKHSDLQKHLSCNQDVVCSGNKLCYECRTYRKEHKKYNNKSIRRLNKELVKDYLND